MKVFSQVSSSSVKCRCLKCENCSRIGDIGREMEAKISEPRVTRRICDVECMFRCWSREILTNAIDQLDVTLVAVDKSLVLFYDLWRWEKKFRCIFLMIFIVVIFVKITIFSFQVFKLRILFFTRLTTLFVFPVTYKEQVWNEIWSKYQSVDKSWNDRFLNRYTISIGPPCLRSLRRRPCKIYVGQIETLLFLFSSVDVVSKLFNGIRLYVNKI